MKHAGPAVRDLARRLLEFEACECESKETKVHAGLHACEKLRESLEKLVGIAGFQALLSRALVLAKEEVAWLNRVHVEASGAIQGFDEAAPSQELEAARGGEVLLAQLIDLLVTFIGEALTLRLIRDIWPAPSLSDVNLSSEASPS